RSSPSSSSNSTPKRPREGKPDEENDLHGDAGGGRAERDRGGGGRDGLGVRTRQPVLSHRRGGAEEPGRRPGQRAGPALRGGPLARPRSLRLLPAPRSADVHRGS